ncbi:RpoD subfamily RNA polymerase sigma-70 subunit [Pediococcus stilesii]|uniref:RpoD subfamily RNA polymerase sigma-70 subunit n=2 Tax=Pediococcus stilesii TaxID=331679 RepID=A0A0R2L327_9LACO|nr:RpoD subfamily RNA polymerase sigma-70 subunit [Pediococcus stilesii]
MDDVYFLYKEMKALDLTVYKDENSLLGEMLYIKDDSWKKDVLKIIMKLPSDNFNLTDVYLFDRDLKIAHPGNENIKAKIRQVLQQLRDENYIEFLQLGEYKRLAKNERIEDDTNSIKKSEQSFDELGDLDTLLSSKEFITELANIKEAPTFENNSEYIERIQANEDTEALEQLYKANDRLIWKIVSRYTQYATTSFDMYDMYIEGAIGLKRALERFDLSRGLQFSTYATWWIRQGITRAIADQSNTVRLPVHMQEKINRLTKIENRLSIKLGRVPTNEEVMNVWNEDGTNETINSDEESSMEEIKKLKTIRSNFGTNLISLDVPVGSSEGGTTLGELLPEKEIKSELDLLDEKELHNEIEKMLGKLSDRQAKVIRMRFGIDDYEEKTLEEVGQSMGVTRERIRQIQNKSLFRLKKIAHLDHVDAWNER